MFRRFLGIDPDVRRPRLPPPPPLAPAGSAAETATVRQIVSRLDALPPDEARYLACFAYVMSRAAQADLSVSDEETAVMERFAASTADSTSPRRCSSSGWRSSQATASTARPRTTS